MQICDRPASGLFHSERGQKKSTMFSQSENQPGLEINYVPKRHGKYFNIVSVVILLFENKKKVVGYVICDREGRLPHSPQA